MRYSEQFRHVHADVRDPYEAEPISGVEGIGWTAQHGWQALAELAELAEVSG